jgi:hypothetical protein
MFLKKGVEKILEKLCPSDFSINSYMFKAQRIQVGIQNAWYRNVSIAHPK